MSEKESFLDALFTKTEDSLPDQDCALTAVTIVGNKITYDYAVFDGKWWKFRNVGGCMGLVEISTPQYWKYKYQETGEWHEQQED